MNRRGFLGSILAAAAAPAIVRVGSLMGVRPITAGYIVIPRIAAIKGEILSHLGDQLLIRSSLTREMIAYGAIKAGEPTFLLPGTKNPGDTLTYRRRLPYVAASAKP